MQAPLREVVQSEFLVSSTENQARFDAMDELLKAKTDLIFEKASSDFEKIKDLQERLRTHIEVQGKTRAQETQNKVSHIESTILKAVRFCGDEVQKLRQESSEYHAAAEAYLDRQLKTNLEEFDSRPDLHNIAKRLETDFSHLDASFKKVSEEVDRVKQSNSLGNSQMEAMKDFLASQVEAIKKQNEPSTPRSARKRALLAAKQSASGELYDDVGIQTDPPDVEDAWIQTDDVLLKKRKDKARKALRHTDIKSHELQEVRTRKSMVMAKKGPANVFADEGAMKKKVRQKLVNKPYNVHNFYKESGFFQKIAKSTIFENLTFFVIFLNSIWIAVDSDYNDAAWLISAAPVFIAIENLFCAFFTIEIIIRFCAFEHKCNAFRDFWFVFDFVLQIYMVSEIWIMTLVLFAIGHEKVPLSVNGSFLKIVRIVKLLRLSRMARLLRSIPELSIIVKAMVAAGRSVVVIIMFSLLIVYVFAIILKQILEGEATNLRYGSVLDSMNTLITYGIFADSSDLVQDVSRFPVLWPVIMLFIILTSVCLMYMLVGVMVNVVSMVANTEREAVLVTYLADALRDRMLLLNYDTEAPLPVNEFKDLLSEPEVMAILGGVDVDVYFLQDMAEQIYEDFQEREGIGMTFGDVVDCVLNLRGCNPATVGDIKGSMRTLKSQMQTIVTDLQKNLSVQFTQLKAEMKKLDGDDDDSESGDEVTQTAVDTTY
jgi:voltage-gated sodium channel